MRTALTDAGTATSTAERITALRRAVHAYTGPLADGHDYDWIEPYRYKVARQAADAALRLAEELTDRPEEARTVLATAIEHHPYDEQLYRAAMSVHAQRGDAAAIRALRKAMTHRLDEIDAEPSDDTIELAGQYIVAAQRRTRARTRRPGGTP